MQKQNNYLCTFYSYGAGRAVNDFDAGTIHYKGHWGGGGGLLLKIKTFLGPGP